MFPKSRDYICYEHPPCLLSLGVQVHTSLIWQTRGASGARKVCHRLQIFILLVSPPSAQKRRLLKEASRLPPAPASIGVDGADARVRGASRAVASSCLARSKMCACLVKRCVEYPACRWARAWRVPHRSSAHRSVPGPNLNAGSAGPDRVLASNAPSSSARAPPRSPAAAASQRPKPPPHTHITHRFTRRMGRAWSSPKRTRNRSEGLRARERA